MNALQQFYKGKRVLVTGAHGFKGGWLSLWLSKLGAEVYAAGIDAKTSATFFENCVSGVKTLSVTDGLAVLQAVKECSPEIVFHLAAQAIVSVGIDSPHVTMMTNVGGTLNVLSACTGIPHPPRVIVVTSDKCYWPTDARVSEDARLGGRDPYSASKACAELVCECWRECYGVDVRTVRAGNVIGGGDLSKNRLVPDYIEAVRSGNNLEVRNPSAIRPWQHVLDCLAGYLMAGMATEWPNAVNFGPEKSEHTVHEMIILLDLYFNSPNLKMANGELSAKESSVLNLNVSLAKSLGWKPLLSLEDSVELTAKWYHCWLYGPQDMAVVTSTQIDDYMALGAQRGVGWAVDGSKWLSDLTP